MSAMLGVIRSSLAGRSMMVLRQEDAGLRIGPSIKRPRSGRHLKVRRSSGGAFRTRLATWLRRSTALARRFEAKLHCQADEKMTCDNISGSRVGDDRGWASHSRV